MAVAELSETEGRKTLSFMCPACRTRHVVFPGEEYDGEHMWFNGDLCKPTFFPSAVADDGNLCRFRVVRGEITFLAGTEHSLVGRTLPLETI